MLGLNELYISAARFIFIIAKSVMYKINKKCLMIYIKCFLTYVEMLVYLHCFTLYQQLYDI